MRVLEIGNDRLRLEVLPECGGKIRSWMDLDTGKEWMWQNPSLPQSQPEYGQNFERCLDTGGWDELLPTVGPCEVNGVSVPDHGDLVSQPWEVVDHSEGKLAMVCRARSMPMTMEREIRVADGSPGFVLAYTLRNESDRALPFLFATHPLFPLESGSRLELSAGSTFHVAGTLGAVEVGRTVGIEKLNRLLAGDGAWAMKLFSETSELSSVGFRHSDGSGIRMSWDAELLPVLGLWVNFGGWSGTGGVLYQNIGIEPGNATCDALSEAMSAGAAGELAAGEIRCWEIRVELLRPQA